MFALLLLLGTGCDVVDQLDGWSVSTHPCDGYRTDILWMDDDQTGWVGCGTAAIGQGLYGTDNAGESWEAVSTEPAGFFDSFRVNDIHRGDDDLLYIAGNDANGRRVVSADTTSAPWALVEELTTDDISGGFSIGSFARTSSGFAVAESLTGADVVWRDGDDGAWQDGYSWWPAEVTAGYQILDLDTDGSDIYGCGSTISQPPMVFLPPLAGGFGFESVQLATGISEYTGELFGIAVDGDDIVVGGVNQDRDVGMAYVSGSDPYDAETWSAFDVSTLIADDSAIRGVCRDGSTIALVGEKDLGGAAVLIVSEDGGANWTDRSDTFGEEGEPLQQCVVLSSGAIAVAGGSGFFAID